MCLNIPVNSISAASLPEWVRTRKDLQEMRLVFYKNLKFKATYVKLSFIIYSSIYMNNNN